MSAFNSPEEVIAWADRAAADNFERHIKYGHDLNPYCTPGARNDWQRGFDNAPLRSWERGRAYDTQFQRGRAMARLLESKKAAGEWQCPTP